MKKVGDMKLYSFEELLEEDYGKVGTPERDAFERSVDEAVQAYRVGEAIKQAREAQNLTQAELGEKMGVQRAQTSFLRPFGSKRQSRAGSVLAYSKHSSIHLFN